MTREEGRFILNAARDGAPVPERAVTRALTATGDFNRNTWAHVSALNLIADHEAGIHVDPMRLQAARDLVQRANRKDLA